MIRDPEHYIYTLTSPASGRSFSVIAIPKNGCTSLKYILHTVYGGTLDQVAQEARNKILRDNQETNDTMWIHERSVHPYAKTTIDKYVDVIYLPYRNPARRLVSAWIDKWVVAGGRSAGYSELEDFVKEDGPLDELVHTDPHFMPQSEFESLVPDHLKSKVQWVYFKWLIRSIGLGIPVPSNQGVSVPSSFLTLEPVRAALHRLYSEDLKRLEYDPDTPATPDNPLELVEFQHAVNAAQENVQLFRLKNLMQG